MGFLAKYYRFGENRGKEGNGLKRKMLRAIKVTGTNTPRFKKDGIYTSLLDNLLAEPIHEEGERPEFMITLRNKPLIGSIKEAQVITDYEKVVKNPGSDKLDELDKEHANLQHAGREITRINGLLANAETEEDKTALNAELAKYEEERTKLITKITALTRLARPYFSHQREYIKARVKNIRLRVKAVSYDKNTASYTCITEPAIFKIRGV